jgi:hypothetical protein
MANPPAPDRRPTATSKADAGREARLAAALRANLRRRKAQARLGGARPSGKPAGGEGGQ